MRIEIIDSDQAFAAMRPSWNELAAGLEFSHVCLSFEWFWSWWSAFGKGRLLRILLAYDGSRLVGIAPLMISRELVCGIPLKTVRFLYNDNAPCADFLVATKPRLVLKAFFEHLAHTGREWDRIVLDNIPEDSKHSALIEDALSQNGWLFYRKEGLRSPYLVIDSDWDGFCRHKGKKFIKTRRNISNRISRAGMHRIEMVKEYAGARAVMEDIVGISGRSWKRRSRRDFMHRKNDLVFFRHLCREFGLSRMLRIWVLRLDNIPIAYEFHLARENNIYGLKADFDAGFASVSPGTYLDTEITKRYFNDRIDIYDLGGHDDEAYKKRWTPLRRLHTHYVIYKRECRGMLLVFVQSQLVIPLKEALKKMAFVRRIRRILSGRGR
ncbi:MAG: GNAT family N-acetyltransferase [Candidatus Omnitrophica bacterium]|nr:GNAT family N-acetyltransferase [Candidatus Omnitrophota bacterium]